MVLLLSIIHFFQTSEIPKPDVSFGEELLSFLIWNKQDGLASKLAPLLDLDDPIPALRFCQQLGLTETFVQILPSIKDPAVLKEFINIAIRSDDRNFIISLFGKLDPNLSNTLDLHGLSGLITHWKNFPELLPNKLAGLEIAFLLQDAHLAGKFLALMPRKERSIAIAHLQKLYPFSALFLESTMVHLSLFKEEEERRLSANKDLSLEKKQVKALISRGDEDLTTGDHFLSRATKVKDYYQKDCFVFTHGQSTFAAVLTQFVHKLIKERFPTLYHPLNPPFRFPGMTKETGMAREYCKKFNADASDNQLNENGGDVLSVDALITHDEPLESALNFVGINSNITLTPFRLKEITLKILKQFHTIPEETQEQLANALVMIALEKMESTDQGTLCVISIPKSVVKHRTTNFTYAAHPFGKPCGIGMPCSHNRIKILKRLQKGERVRCAKPSSAPSVFAPIIQYRILAAKMAQEPGVRIISIDSCSQATHKLFKQKIKDLIATIPCVRQ